MPRDLRRGAERAGPKAGVAQEATAGCGDRCAGWRACCARGGLHTVCESALCPNLGECFARGTATFLIMGDVCTRDCGFCGVATGRPAPLDPAEPENVADAVARLGAVARGGHVGDARRSADGGAASLCGHHPGHPRARRPEATVEVLMPDFSGRRRCRRGAGRSARGLQPQCRDGASSLPDGAAAGGVRAVARVLRHAAGRKAPGSSRPAGWSGWGRRTHEVRASSGGRGRGRGGHGDHRPVSSTVQEHTCR